MTWPPAGGGAVPGPDPDMSPPPGTGFPGFPPPPPGEVGEASPPFVPVGPHADAPVPPPAPPVPLHSFGPNAVFVPAGNGTVLPWERKPIGRTAEEKQARLVERMRSLMETSRDIVFMLATDGTLTLLSQSFENLTGWSRKEWLGKYFGPLIHPDDLPIARNVMARMLRGEAPPAHELRLTKRDGGYVEMEMVSTPVTEGGKVIEVVGFGRDIRERKEVERAHAYAKSQRLAKEEAEAANRAKDEFIAALSHELRTPLTPVLTLATALEDEAHLPWPCQDAMRIVRRNVELEARLIDDLLDLTRIIRGKLHLRFEVVDVHRLLREVLDICEDDLRGKRLTAVVDLGAAESVTRADAARLEQVFWNLVKNAVKFTPDGGTIWVTTSNDDGGKRIRVCVRDNGVGINPEAMGRIFDAFEQGGEAVTRRYGGLGLGLAIGKGIVDAHGGRIMARSPGVNRGATFEVDLATLPGAKEAAAEAPARRSAHTARILLVEDHADTAHVMATLLKGRGHDVEHCVSVAAALAAVRRKPFDIMISDLGLPDGTGWDLMREVKRIHPPTCGIALSGYGMEQDLQRSKDAGFEHHVVKPFNFATLTELIQRMAGDRDDRPAPEGSDLGE